MRKIGLFLKKIGFYVLDMNYLKYQAQEKYIVGNLLNKASLILK